MTIKARLLKQNFLVFENFSSHALDEKKRKAFAFS